MIFEQLPIIFAVGVAIGFTGGAAVSGLASVIGCFTLFSVLKTMGELRHLSVVMNTGVLGGILIGLLSASIYNRYYQTRLHPILGFFSGKRLVPILTAAAALLVGLILGFVWPPLQEQINYFSQNIMHSYWGPAFYAAGKRLLIPIGLHHVYYQPFLYQFGDYVTTAGQILHGETARYFGGDPSAGLFMASEFPIMLFGLPAAALAITLRALPSQRKVIAGVMFSAALTSIITGITEPIEFAFLFVSPLLYGFHVIAAFFSGILTRAFDMHLGYTFSASLIDYVLGFYNQKNSFFLFTVVGPSIGLLYFFVFYGLIEKLNLKTPGREIKNTDPVSQDLRIQAQQVLSALGGGNNLKILEACITRLRVTVFQSELVQVEQLKTMGATGVVNVGENNFQIILGVKSDLLKDEMKKIIFEQTQKDFSSDTPVITQKSSVLQKKIRPEKGSELILKSPLEGKIYPLEEVPDPTFAGKTLGDGFAIMPTHRIVYAPVQSTVTQVFRTRHALCLKTDQGDLDILIHVGLNTVQLKGEGFCVFVKEGDHVNVGDRLLEFDPEWIQSKEKSLMTPIVIINMDQVKKMDLLIKGDVTCCDDVLRVQF